MNKQQLLSIVFLHLFVGSLFIFVFPREHWFDVSFSLETAHKLSSDGFNSIDFRSFDVHPPTYYYLLAVWQKLNFTGITEYQWAQLLSLIFGSVFVVFATLTVEKAFKHERYAFIIGIIFALATTYIHISTEVRMYSLVLMLSAIGFYGVFARGKWLVGTVLAIFYLPNVHYLAAIASICMVAFYFVLLPVSDRFKDNVLWLFVVALITGVGFALTYAIPQMIRGEGTWFLAPSAISIPSALFYSLFTINDMYITSIFAWLIFILFCISLPLIFYKMHLVLKNNSLNEQETNWVLFVFTALIPTLYIVSDILLIKLTGGGGFLQLYHHRFFLSVTWLFAAGYLFWLLSCVDRVLFKHEVIGFLLVFAIGFSVMNMVGVYADNQNHELENMMKSTPCSDELVVIGHESPFSALPYNVWAREHSCNWFNFISTNISVAMSRSAGFDIISSTQLTDSNGVVYNSVYWNLTLPEQPFLYIQSDAQTFQITDRDQMILAQDEGIRLIQVGVLNG